MQTQVNEIEKNTIGTIEVKYYRPKFAHRVLANLVDIIIFILVFLGLFIGTRSIVVKTDKVSSTIKKLDTYKLESGMYYERDGSLIDAVAYFEGANLTPDGKIKAPAQSISRFFTFIEEYRNEADYETIFKQYSDSQLNEVSEGHHLFYLSSSGEILRSVDASEIDIEHLDDKEYFLTHKYTYYYFYCNQIDNRFQGYFVTTPVVYDLNKTLNTYLIWVEVPIAYVLAVVIVYFVPTVFFKRTRYTLGKALYRIGTVDSRYLAVSFPRNLAKWSIFLLEMILGIASAGIIFICSFTLMVLSKRKQGFPDYMLGLQEIDCSKNKIYKNYVEIELDKAETNKKPNDFKLIDNP